MTQEDKQLLLKDLSARLPYGVKCKFFYTENKKSAYGISFLETEISFENIEWLLLHKDDFVDVKPYLRPMSSMTEEEASEMFRLMFPDRNLISVEIEKNGVRFGQTDNDGVFGHVFLFFNKIYSLEQFDWLNKKMFDYRGLIPMGITLEPPEGMYKNE